VDLIKKNPLKISHLKLITTTGSPLAPSSAVYVYKHLHPNVHLSSISGGTDLNGCFALGSPFLNVYPAELQCPGLGMDVQVWNESGDRIIGQNGELVCLNPFPNAPLFFWGDPDHSRYLDSYFSMYPNIWAQGDLAEQTKRLGFYVKGRSDSTLNPGGVRIGTSDYYDILQLVDEVQDAVVIGQRQPDGNENVILFVQLKPGTLLNQYLIQKIQDTIRKHLSARHRPSVIAQVSAIPVNVNGKKMEKLAKKLANEDSVSQSEISSLKNPECMNEFRPKNWNTGAILSRL
jgi:acetoacetyl-CoA synthetase